MSDETILQDEIEIQKKLYWKNKRKYLKPIEKQMGIKIKECDFIPNNEVFKRTLEELSIFDLLVSEGMMKVEYSSIHSLVQVGVNNIYKMKYHNCITIFFPDGSHIRFSPYKKGIELTRLYVIKENIGQGQGSSLMRVFLGLLKQSNIIIPEIMTEITGSVGLGENFIDVGLDYQLNFYEKFGFKTTNSNKRVKKLIRPEGLEFPENS